MSSSLSSSTMEANKRHLSGDGENDDDGRCDDSRHFPLSIENAERPTDRPTDRPIDRPTDRPTDRRTRGRPTYLGGVGQSTRMQRQTSAPAMGDAGSDLELGGRPRFRAPFQIENILVGPSEEGRTSPLPMPQAATTNTTITSSSSYGRRESFQSQHSSDGSFGSVSGWISNQRKRSMYNNGIGRTPPPPSSSSKAPPPVFSPSHPSSDLFHAWSVAPGVAPDDNYNPDIHPALRSVAVASGGVRRTHRRYGVGDFVLISNHRSPIAQLVNRYGFPDGEGASSEERRGPYIYLLAQVKSVHFEEDAQYYTVTREDTGGDQRADAEWMEPLRNQRGIEAAKMAARRKESLSANILLNGTNRGDHSRGLSNKFLNCIVRPFLFAVTWSFTKLRKGWKSFYIKFRKQASMCLNGNRPYSASIRLTGINFLVLCSIWYLYIDQLRLAFFPHSADYALAVVSCVVWTVLFLELIFEVFIRPDGYWTLLQSDKAYLPSTVRHLDTFHFVAEMVSLAFFLPEFFCLFDSKGCGAKRAFSLSNSCLMSIYGPTRRDAFYGRAFLCLLWLRIFGLVRHWKQMWINNTFVMLKGKDGQVRVQRGKGMFVPQGFRHGGRANVVARVTPTTSATNAISLATKSKEDIATVEGRKEPSINDHHLTNASKIGTALLITNSRRGLLLIFLIGLTPLIRVGLVAYGGTNQQLTTSVKLLQENNIAINRTDAESCNYLEDTIFKWISGNAFEVEDGEKLLHLMSLQVLPVRCEFQRGPDGSENIGTVAAALCRNDTYTRCESLFSKNECNLLCQVWLNTSVDKHLRLYEQQLGIRPSVTFTSTAGALGSYSLETGEIIETYFSVEALFNEQKAIERSIITLFFLQLSFTIFALLSLSVLRSDAGRLVLGPLRRMLKIVAFYANNPLSPPPKRETNESEGVIRSSHIEHNGAYYDSDDEASDQLGTFETEKLINTVTKITDLLRKCWGVAGAGIISSNLARQEDGLTTYFNPTVPGKAVYALFAFAAIDRFQSHLHALKGDIMILINDIAAVLHEEVYRWGYGDSGQCNKNLGGAFLMVYRIGTVSEVVEKREKAKAVIFSEKHRAGTRRRRSRGSFKSTSSNLSGVNSSITSHSNVDSLDLSSLPGMRVFADRALLGLLKTFAGIHRDKTLLNWNDDFRLGAGVGAASINMIFGMDAGWAVEGAVGSAYKIDATYLSPHVNMASRMMSATKQYGVFFLLSQAVQELLSEAAQTKLRHIDTVTVKGSSVQQKIFTYDAKARSDFFLYSKTEDQADLDSERFSAAIWSTDQDLVAMRNHISDEFIEVFNRGREEYLAGNWKKAIELLKNADEIMFRRVVDEGYVSHVPLVNLRLSQILDNDDPNDGSEERLALGDGPCQRLISFMNYYGGRAPRNWSGYRPLTSK